jgi:copper chaperone CopZ
MKTITLKLTDMRCTACAILLDTVLEELKGVKASKTSYAEQRIQVEYDEALVSPEQMFAVIKDEGYTATLE